MLLRLFLSFNWYFILLPYRLELAIQYLVFKRILMRNLDFLVFLHLSHLDHILELAYIAENPSLVLQLVHLAWRLYLKVMEIRRYRRFFSGIAVPYLRQLLREINRHFWAVVALVSNEIYVFIDKSVVRVKITWFEIHRQILLVLRRFRKLFWHVERHEPVSFRFAIVMV